MHLEKGSRGLAPNQDAIDRLANTPELPPAGASVWADFLELHLRREYSETGPKPLAWSAIHAWQMVTGSRIEDWELRAILDIENIFFEVRAETK